MTNWSWLMLKGWAVTCAILSNDCGAKGQLNDKCIFPDCGYLTSMKVWQSSGGSAEDVLHQFNACFYNSTCTFVKIFISRDILRRGQWRILRVRNWSILLLLNSSTFHSADFHHEVIKIIQSDENLHLFTFCWPDQQRPWRHRRSFESSSAGLQRMKRFPCTGSS